MRGVRWFLTPRESLRAVTARPTFRASAQRRMASRARMPDAIMDNDAQPTIIDRAASTSHVHVAAEPSALKRFGVAVVSTAIAIGVASVVDLPLDYDTNLPLLVAVTISAWYGRLWAGVLSALLSALAISVLFIPASAIKVAPGLGEVIYVGTFLAVSVIVSNTAEALHRSRRDSERLAEQTLLLQRVTRRLSEATTVEDVTVVLLSAGVACVGAISGALVLSDEFAASNVVLHPSPDATSRSETQLAYPLESGGRQVGTLSLRVADETAFKLRNEAFASLLAQAAADSLARAGTFDAERTRRREAELQARTRAEVLGAVAHDLRNPIHTILSTSELLLAGQVPAARHTQVLEMSQRAARHMDRLVGDLLDATRLRAGHLNLARADLAVASLVNDLDEAWRATASQADVVLVSTCPDDVGNVHADHDRMLQALGNLLGNAIKFAGANGRVMLGARAVDGIVEFAVRDTGPGIPQQELPRLFEKFWQANTADRRGIGLGLAISKGIIEAHGGDIRVASIEGHGTTFTVRIPVHDADRRLPVA